MKRQVAFLLILLFASGLASASGLMPPSMLTGRRVWLPLEEVDDKTVHAYSPLSGMRVTVDTTWFPAGGYLPVELLFECQQPSPSDREITVRVESLQSKGQPAVAMAAALAVEQRATLATGESSLRLRVLVPRVQEHAAAIRWETKVNGVVDPAIGRGIALPTGDTSQRLRILAPGVGGRTSRAPVVAPDSSGVISILEGFRKTVAEGKRRLRCEPPESWLDYSAADVTAFSTKNLEKLAEESPSRLSALRRWVLAGGTLWVEGAGFEAEELLAIDGALGVSGWRQETTPEEREGEEAAPPIAEADRSEGELGEPGDEVGEKSEDSKARFEPIVGAPGWGFQRANGEDLESILKAIGKENRESSSRGWYATRRVGFGRVIAFAGAAWQAPARMRFGESELYRQTWLDESWSKRHGIEPGRSSARFGNLLIPGVGVAPVGAFQLLVTLFVLVIGPLNYWLLWRRGQLQMLVLTVPLGALLSTGGLLFYAGIADGFGVKARVRSLALIDQTQGEAVTWSRVSHYVATSPDSPAVLPPDTAIYPITPAWEASITGKARSLETLWDERGQVLRSGWAPRRNAVQHLLIRSGETDAQIAIRQEAGELRAANRLGAPIELLFVHDQDGAWWRAEATPAGDVAKLETIPRFEAVREFRLTTIDNQPEFPVGAGQQIEQTLQRLGDRRNVRRLQNQIGEVSLIDNLQERVIGRLSGLTGGRGLELPPRSYVAVTRQSVTTPLGWDDVQEYGSFHVIVGRW